MDHSADRSRDHASLSEKRRLADSNCWNDSLRSEDPSQPVDLADFVTPPDASIVTAEAGTRGANPARHCSRNTSLYFIRVAPDGPIKIGLARNVQRRLEQLQIGNHAELFIFAEYVIPEHLALELESLIHGRLRRARIHGEWFDPTPTVIGAAKNPRKFAADQYARVSA